MHAYIHTYVHTYIRTYIHTYIHTYIQGCMLRTPATSLDGCRPNNNVLGLRVVSTCRSLRQNDLPTAKTWMASKPFRKTIKIFKIGSTPPRVVSHTNIEMIVADPLIKSRLKSRAVWVFHWPHFPSPSSQSYPAIGRRSSQKSPVPIQLFWIGYFPILKSRRLL